MDRKTKVFYLISWVLVAFQIYYSIWLIYSQIIKDDTFNGSELMSPVMLYISVVLPFATLLVNIVVLIKDRTANKRLAIFNYVCIILEPMKYFQYLAVTQGIMALLNNCIFDKY